MIITCEMFLGSKLYAIQYKGVTVFNRSIASAIAQLLNNQQNTIYMSKLIKGKGYKVEYFWLNGKKIKIIRVARQDNKQNNNMQKKNIKTKEEARNYAIEWQSWQSNQNMSYVDLIEWRYYFADLADKFHLVREFKENGII